MHNDFIFVAGAPGSKWSSVVKNIYYSPGVDRSDYSDERTYYHSAWGQPELMHLGAYFDPGMEFGRKFMRLPLMSAIDSEQEFNRPFTNIVFKGKRIIKSHVFCHHLDYIKTTWPNIPIVLVHRPNDACLGWWVRCGQFDITYPNYQYYSNLQMMAMHIDQQNADMLNYCVRNDIDFDVEDNYELCDRLGIARPSNDYRQNYAQSDIRVAIA
jgi:hypothetical protein